MLRLCIDGRWRVIIVDDQLPCYANGRIAFCEGNKNQVRSIYLRNYISGKRTLV